jgi:rubrerythrin
MRDVQLNALKRAMQLEKEGMAYYQASRDKARSQIGRDMFAYLCKSEEGHIRRIRDIYHALEKSGIWPEHSTAMDKTAEVCTTIFSRALADLNEKQSLDTNDIEALEQAAEFERRGENFYAERLEMVTDPFERNFYTQLAREEFNHLKAIQDSILMLKDPQGFFADREFGTLAG